MNVTNNIPAKQNIRQSAFKGQYSPVLNAFKNKRVNGAFEKLEDPTMKLLFVNCTSLIVPGIIVDSFRNKYAGAETAFYQLFNTGVNYLGAGVIAFSMAGLLKNIFNPQKVNTKGWVGNASVNCLKDHYSQNISKYNKADGSKQFVKDILNKVSASPGGKHVNLSTIGDDQLSNIATDILNSKSSRNNKKLMDIVKRLGNHLGAVDNIAIATANTGEPHKTNIGQLVKDLSYLGEEFKKAGDASTLEKIASKVKNTNRIKTATSVFIVMALGFYSQHINNWITKKRTGKSGFVGYKEFGQDVTGKNTENKENTQPSFKGKGFKIPSLESKQFIPTYEQLKWLIYPAGIIGKNLFCRSNDERREVAFKTSFAFLNFLVIPNLVDNLVAYSYKNKHLFSNSKNKLFSNNPNANPLQKLGNFFKNLPGVNKLKIKSYKDIEAYSHYVAQEMKDSNVSEKTLSEFVKNPSPELISEINSASGTQKAEKIAGAIQKELKGIKNVSKFTSIAYSLLTLGIGINVINILITNKKHKKFLKQKNEAENAKNSNVNHSFKLELVKDPKLKNLYSDFLVSNNS